ncbi:MAG: response regulator [Alphaproteobacteria bacterium]|jgi:PAS domain S-box-containing protein|nr:response regulator [Alphaproteobacteria bacterium]MDP6516930.1 response regulator [Alphaproteobacteria bacterium]
MSEGDGQGRLEVLRATFAAQLDGRLDELRAAAHQLTGSDGREATAGLERLRDLAHKLAGAGGTFGFAALGEAAGKLEQLCEPPGDGIVPAAPERIRHIHRLLDRLGTLAGAGPDTGDADRSAPGLSDRRRGRGSIPKTVIVVEDDPVQLAMMKLLLTNFGFDVVGMAEPSGLRETLAETTPAAVVMDIMFPGDDDAGVSAIKSLRADGEISCPVIFLSVRDDFDARLSAVRAGCDCYLLKPLNNVQLVDTLYRLAEDREADPYRVLIVEDDPEVATVNQDFLIGAGFEARATTDPMVAMQAASEFGPDLILMDINMPECDGFELAAAIRSNPAFESLPIMYLTAESSADKRLKAIQSGGDDFLTKPVAPDTLISSVTAKAGRARALNAVVARLQTSEERFRSVAQSAKEGIVLVNIRGLIVFWNAGAEAIFGYSEDEILGRSFTDLSPKRYRDSHMAIFGRTVLGEETGMLGQSMEAVGLRKNGQEFPFEVSYSDWKSGGRQFFTGIIRDITERKQTEHALRDSERRAERAQARLVDAIESLPASFTLYDQTDRLVLSNSLTKDHFPALADMAAPGTAFVDILRRLAESGQMTDAVGREGEWIAERLAAHRNPPHTAELSLADGRTVQVTDRRTSEGGTVRVRTDITEQKRAEAALLEAKDIAEKANAAKSRFLAAASHDLRQPLHALNLFIGALSQTIDDPDSGEIIADMQNAVEIVRGMLDSLLDISRLDSGSITPEISSFKIDALLQRMTGEFTAPAREHGLAMRVVPCRLWVRSDYYLLERIVENFLSNAVRYCETGRILLGCRRRGDALRIEVWDSGIGIPPDKLEDIFEEYYQLGNPARDRSKGLGLGLALVDRLAKLLGHRVDIRSRPGKGSMFSVEVPIVAGETDGGSLSPTSMLATDGFGRPVVVVDDDAMVLDATGRLLRHWGFQVLPASSASAIMDRLAVADAPRPALIIADYRLSECTTGIELIRRIRQASGIEIPAILMTGDTAPTVSGCPGTDDYLLLHKPVDSLKLRALIHQLLDNDPVAPQVGTAAPVS